MDWRRATSKRMTIGVLVAVAIALTAAACTSDDDGETLPTVTADAADTTEATVSTTEAEPTETTADTAVAAAEIADRWTGFITLAASRPDPTELADLASAEAIETADTRFFEAREPQTFYPQVDVNGDTASIEDCVLLERPLSDFHYVPMTGRATLTDGAWQITALTVDNPDKCLPGNFAAEVLTAYEGYWDARLEYLNPPDPASPLIAQFTTGDRRDTVLDVIEQQLEANVVWRGRPETNPVLAEFVPGVVVIDDCQFVDLESGYYDGTGNRTDLSNEVEPGQTDLTRTRLEFVDGSWKVGAVGVDENVACEPDTVDRPIPILGPAEGVDR